MTGVYIHIPYCVRKCGYCDFYSVCDTTTAEDYTAAVCKLLNALSGSADTLYFGGGTPSLLNPELLCRMIDSASHVLTADAEITVEVNPGDNIAALLPDIAKAGVNRLSIGMQSHCDDELKLLTRRHTSFDVDIAVELALKSGIANISLDVMLGIEGQTITSLDKTLDFCADSGATHVSAYMLKIEEGTPFSVADYNPTDDLQSQMYLHTVDRLCSLGFNQYEISNFCRGNHRSRHNMKYWTGQDYIGIGPAAHSYVGGRRHYYPRDIDSFIKGTPPIDDGQGGGYDEQVMLALRLSDGLDLNRLAVDYPLHINNIEAAKKVIPQLIKADLAKCESNVLTLTPKGFLVSNQIIGIFL